MLALRPSVFCGEVSFDGDSAFGFQFESEDASGLFDDLGDADPDGVGRIGRAFDDDDPVGFTGLFLEGCVEALGELGELERAAVQDDAGGCDGDLDVFTLFLLFLFLFGFRKDLRESGLRLHGGADEEEDDEDEGDIRAGAGRRIDEHLAAFQFHEEPLSRVRRRVTTSMSEAAEDSTWRTKSLMTPVK